MADTAAPARFGREGELFAAGRMDNLSSVHAGLVALLAAPDDAAHVSVLAAFDHEELGSESRSGASGPFLEDVLARVAAGLGADDGDRRRAFADSWLLSSDAGHAVHPNYPERHDPSNRPVLGGGPLLKLNANQRYATDGVGAAMWARACRQAGVHGAAVRVEQHHPVRQHHRARSARPGSASARSTWARRCSRCTPRASSRTSTTSWRSPRRSPRSSRPPATDASPGDDAGGMSRHDGAISRVGARAAVRG